MGRLDIGDQMADHRHMSIRAFISLLMMVLILPWGAYAAGPVAAAPQLATQTAMPDDTGLYDAKGAEITARKHCRTAILPGSLCGADSILPIRAVGATDTQGPTVQMHPLDWPGQGQSPSPPRDPPRVI